MFHTDQIHETTQTNTGMDIKYKSQQPFKISNNKLGVSFNNGVLQTRKDINVSHNLGY